EADIGIGPISISSERRRSVDMTLPCYDFVGLQLLVAAPDSSANSVSFNDGFLFARALRPELWACLGAALLTTALLVTLFDRFSPCSFRNRPPPPSNEVSESGGKVFSIGESLWYSLGALTQAGDSFDPRAPSARLIVAGFWLLCCIMHALYTANLAALLTASQLTASSVTTLRRLAAQTDIKYTVQRNTIGHDFFERMADIESKFFNIWRSSIEDNGNGAPLTHGAAVWEYPIEERFTRMLGRMKEWGLANSTQEAVSLARTGSWAVFMDTPLARYYASRDCRLRTVGEVLSSRPYGIVLQKGSLLTKKFDMAILQMQQDRTLETLKMQWWNSGHVNCPADARSIGLKLSSISGIFVLPILGVCLGFLALLAELTMRRIQRCQQTAAEAARLQP
uniref:PBPe domain-containing protein n=1 Tax=Macrostomum lignano TaxID=282301 RepID=A0A1I8I3K3_9PLAT